MSLDRKRQTIDENPNFNWKVEMYKAQTQINKRIKQLEQTGNVACTIRTKSQLTKLNKRIKDMWEIN